MKTIFWLVTKENKPKLLTTASEPDVPIFEGSLIQIKDKNNSIGLYEVTNEIWELSFWGESGEVIRNLYLSKSIAKEDNLARKGVLDLYDNVNG